VSSSGKASGCILCAATSGVLERDADTLVLFRGQRNYVIINKYPYSSGHLMVAPYEHVADLRSASTEQISEMMRLAQACETILSEAYDPEGFNIGMNIGKAAGAGVVDHQHLHIVPRWTGDASFMSATADTRVIPETPDGTYARLRPMFDQHFSEPEPEQS
jgi:ATP adenylyltransferase